MKAKGTGVNKLASDNLDFKLSKRTNRDCNTGVSEMAQWIKGLPHKPGDLSSITGIHAKVEGEN